MAEVLLSISKELAERIRAHGAETYPHECCGALLGRDNEPREILGLFPSPQIEIEFLPLSIAAMIRRRIVSPSRRRTCSMRKSPHGSRGWMLLVGITRTRIILRVRASTIAITPGRGTATSSSAWRRATRRI